METVQFYSHSSGNFLAITEHIQRSIQVSPVLKIPQDEVSVDWIYVSLTKAHRFNHFKSP